jgi:ABC-type antimicrobial peptide transport system ATPase subunit
MKTIYRIQYFKGKQWKKTYFGTQHEGGLFHHVTLQDAKDEIKVMQQYQKEVGEKLTKYRILEIIYEEIVHENF